MVLQPGTLHFITISPASMSECDITILHMQLFRFMACIFWMCPVLDTSWPRLESSGAKIASNLCWLDVCGLGCKKCQKGAIFLLARPLLTLSLASMPCLASLGQGVIHIQVFGSTCTDVHILTTVGARKYTIWCVFWFTFSSGSQSLAQCLCFIGQIMYAHLFFLAISFGWVCGPEILVHFVIWCNYNCNELQFT